MAGRPDKGRIATFGRTRSAGPVAGNRVAAWHGMAWRGGAGRGGALVMARRGLARRGRDVFDCEAAAADVGDLFGEARIIRWMLASLLAVAVAGFSLLGAAVVQILVRLL